MRIFLLTLLLSLTLPAFAQENLIVRQSIGDTSYSIAKISHITFPADGSGIVLNFTDGTSKTFAKGRYISLRFNSNISGAEMIECNDQMAIVYHVENEVVTLVGGEATVEIYSSNGTLVDEGENAVNVSHLSAGVYVVKAGVLTSKIMKR